MAELKARCHRLARPREALNDPKLSSGHEQNKLQPIFAARVEPEVKEQAETWIKKAGWTKRQTMEYALDLLQESLSPEEASKMVPQ